MMSPEPAPDAAALSTRRRTWLQRGVVLVIWLGVLIAWRQYQSTSGLSATDSAQRFIDRVDAAWWGVLAYIGIYLVRPLVLFPATVLTVVGGVLFGPVVGVAAVVVAANSSAMVAYGVGRLLRSPSAPSTDRSTSSASTTGAKEASVSGASVSEASVSEASVSEANASQASEPCEVVQMSEEGHESDSGDDATNSLIQRWAARLRENSFETVLVMRFIFLPYDLVSYVAGALRIRSIPFLAATALGSLPGTVSFVLLGASLERVDQGFDGIDPVFIVIGIVLFAASLVIARLLKRRQVDTLPAPPEQPTQHPATQN